MRDHAPRSARGPTAAAISLAPAARPTPWALLGFGLGWSCAGMLAGPAGLTVTHGTASVVAGPGQLNITASANAFLNWQSFNLAPHETARFLQPDASAVVWNRINDANPSQIFGRIEANGIVVLMNASGFYFGPDAVVNAAGLVVSTAPVAPAESGSGLFWQFSGAPPQAAIVNYGVLNAGRGGPLFLVAEHIENHGTLAAPAGQVGLFAGRDLQVSERPDGRGLTARVQLPAGSIDNQGRILADAGTVALHAQVVNQDGLVQADSIRERNGVIELVATEAVNLGPGARLSAQGDAAGPSDGGTIRIKSDGSFHDASSAVVSVAGGASGGNGGWVEVSAPVLPAIHSHVLGTAGPGGQGGRLVIDPQDITLGNSGTGSAPGGSVDAGSPPATGALTLDVNTAFVGFSEIDLQATRNLTLAAGVTWDLGASTGLGDVPGRLRLEAGNNLTIANNATLVAPGDWSVTLEAGRDFATRDGLKPGVGSITFSGTGSLQTERGDVTLRAGNHVTVNSGFVRTTGGGDIDVTAVAGTINTGSKAAGFRFLPTGYAVDPDLGGISTAAGGNVSLTAGTDVLSYLPVAGGVQSDAGSGAFGEAPGNVSIKAGRDVAGHFVLRHGTGTIEAGRNAGTGSRLLALSLVDGGWSVQAAADILLQEVRNPNGIFNNLGFGNAPTRHGFDYAPDAFVQLSAGNAVELRGTALPRYSDAFEQGITPIYPGRLDIAAGAGGISLGNDVTLFPTPQGNLTLNTIDGGDLVGTKAGTLTQLILSDSGKSQYRAFGDFGLADHAATPVHRDDPEPVRLTIAGDVRGLLLGSAKRAEITVGGDFVNSRFDGQNLNPGDVTRLDVTGDIVNRNEFTTVTLDAPPQFDLLELAYPPLGGAVAGVQNQFTYQPGTRELTFQGRMTGEQLQALLTLQVRTFDANGAPILDAQGEPVTRPAAFVSPSALQQLYAASQDVPLNPDSGYRLGGGGEFAIHARNLDLGATVGIVAQGPRANPALAARFLTGADIRVDVDGDLSMFSSRIATLNGGNIRIDAGGDIQVGSRTFTPGDAVARGIYSAGAGNVSVEAGGDINVNGSRIATYDGGNLTVRSRTGNVDAGNGGNGAVTVEKILVDPVSRAVLTYAPTIPGSGLLSTTFPPSLDPAFPASVAPVGNILVETPRGDIRANAGGVVQLPLNGVNAADATVILRAGTRDAAGNVVYAGSIDASGSGVIGSRVQLEASGEIKGFVLARNDLDLIARDNVNVTALAQGNVNINAGGNVSGTVIGLGGLSANATSVDAALLSQNVSTRGEVTSTQVGFAQGTAATGAAQSLQADAPARANSTARNAFVTDDPEPKRTGPRLARTTGRVTVLLPSEPQPPSPSTSR